MCSSHFLYLFVKLKLIILIIRRLRIFILLIEENEVLLLSCLFDLKIILTFWFIYFFKLLGKIISKNKQYYHLRTTDIFGIVIFVLIKVSRPTELRILFCVLAAVIWLVLFKLFVTSLATYFLVPFWLCWFCLIKDPPFKLKLFKATLMAYYFLYLTYVVFCCYLGLVYFSSVFIGNSRETTVFVNFPDQS